MNLYDTRTTTNIFFLKSNLDMRNELKYFIRLNNEISLFCFVSGSC